uniref:Tetratricopeptide repeat protein n=1 Tax=Ditylenchus dipsaci TaxID=166011 RepID=A0A915EJH6_9BILA
MATKTFERSKEWNSEMFLYSSGLTVCPNNPKIHYNIAKVLSDQGHIDEAQKNYLLNSGKKGELEIAEALLTKALIIRPRFSIAWMNLGIVQMSKASYVESEKAF